MNYMKKRLNDVRENVSLFYMLSNLGTVLGKKRATRRVAPLFLYKGLGVGVGEGRGPRPLALPHIVFRP